MPFDPTKPAFGSPDSSAEMRAQLNGLKDLIDAIPIITSVVVDSVTTLNPGELATVTFTLLGTVLHLSLALPRGADGIPGLPGVQGPPGQPFANAVIDSVTTLGPGESATVSLFFDGNNVHFSFAIPQGPQGEQGIQGPMGEDSNATLASAISSAIAGTSNNTNSIPTLDTPFPDPDAEAIRQAYNALVLMLRR